MANTFVQVNIDIDRILQDRGLNPGGRVQKYIDSECLRLCEPFIPRDIAALSQGGSLIDSGITNTVIGTGELKWRTPYARRWYYNVANFQQNAGGRAYIGGQTGPGRGSYWFERMKNQHKDDIIKGANEMANGKR